MAVAKLVYIVYAVLGLMVYHQSAKCSTQHPGDAELMKKVLDSLNKSIRYYKVAFHSMNLDAIFGLRVLEGVAHMLTEEHSVGYRNEFWSDPMIWRQIKYLSREASIISNQAIPYLSEQNHEYFVKFRVLVERPWKIEYRNNRLDVSIGETFWKARMAKVPEQRDEGETDTCMIELIGNPELQIPKCQISSYCWLMATDFGRTRYDVTHQVLYFLLGEQMGCLKQLEQRAVVHQLGTVKNIIHHLCSLMYQETLKLSSNLHVLDQDLFMEQIFCCSAAGYSEFMRRDWLETILSWQLSLGCFAGEFTGDERSLDRDVDDQSRKKLNLTVMVVKEDFINFGKTKLTRRELLVEQRLTDGCLSHKTSVATAALGMYLRYILENNLAPMGNIPPDPVDVHQPQGKQLTQKHLKYHEDIAGDGLDKLPSTHKQQTVTFYLLTFIIVLIIVSVLFKYVRSKMYKIRRHIFKSPRYI